MYVIHDKLYIVLKLTSLESLLKETFNLQVKYTQGGLENLELSRKYFAQALKLNNRNMRALFGLYMVSPESPAFLFKNDLPCYLSLEKEGRKADRFQSY